MQLWEWIKLLYMFSAYLFHFAQQLLIALDIFHEVIMIITAYNPCCQPIYTSVSKIVIGLDNGLFPLSAKLYLKLWLLIINWTLKTNFQWIFNKNTTIFIFHRQNVVCNVAAILSRL